MLRPPKLNFPPVKLRARRQGAQTEVWDEWRGCYLVLTPEEWVRRHLLVFLVERCGACAKRIVQEYPVRLNGQPQRADVVVVDAAGQPLLLAECKAPDVKLDGRTLAQAVRYNSVLGARYILLTNGLNHYCYACHDGQCLPLGAFPDLSDSSDDASCGTPEVPAAGAKPEEPGNSAL